MAARIWDRKLKYYNYWEKLKSLHLYSQERRRERYMIIFIWKISQGLVDGYDIPFTSISSRTGRKAVPASVCQNSPATVQRAREATLAVKGARLFNLMPLNIRNSDHGDILMFKNHLGIYLQDIPDEPTCAGMGRAAASNSLLHQVPLFERNLNLSVSI